MAYDFDIEDIEEFHQRYTWGEGLSNESIYNSKQTLPVICYDLIDLDKTKYHFLQDCFDNKDIKSYFKAIKYISKHTLDELLEENNHEFHFYKSEIRGNLRKVLRELHGEISNNIIYPEIYHFALYTNKETLADRKSNIKSPRIYFLVGAHGMLYILFYDPYHEINP
ncbi:hypothetical protein AB9N12_13390 [Bacteroides sp. AN502(2024)]|uniref:hypothetical protein n=1 Tax=Bacteroides sp. AN502(2024) TaxID=3160599 RepID=UPI003517886D